MSRKRKYAILVVEDEPLIRADLSKKLEEAGEGFEVVGEAHNGQAALESIAGLRPDLLVTDVRLPVLDGLELARQVYHGYPDVKVVIVSGYDEAGYARTALQYGVKDYLWKPVNAAELRSTLSRLLIQLDEERQEREAGFPGPPEAAAREELLHAVQEYIRNHFTGELPIGELARRFHVNPPYLTRVFKRFAGLVPVRYIRDLRLSQARKLLEERPELEIKEIATRVGYPDQGYFSRVFRRALGVSPLEYREGRRDRPLRPAASGLAAPSPSLLYL